MDGDCDCSAAVVLSIVSFNTVAAGGCDAFGASARFLADGGFNEKSSISLRLIFLAMRGAAFGGDFGFTFVFFLVPVCSRSIQPTKNYYNKRENVMPLVLIEVI